MTAPPSLVGVGAPLEYINNSVPLGATTTYTSPIAAPAGVLPGDVLHIWQWSVASFDSTYLIRPLVPLGWTVRSFANDLAVGGSVSTFERYLLYERIADGTANDTPFLKIENTMPAATATRTWHSAQVMTAHRGIVPTYFSSGSIAGSANYTDPASTAVPDDSWVLTGTHSRLTNSVPLLDAPNGFSSLFSVNTPASFTPGTAAAATFFTPAAATVNLPQWINNQRAGRPYTLWVAYTVVPIPSLPAAGWRWRG